MSRGKKAETLNRVDPYTYGAARYARDAKRDALRDLEPDRDLIPLVVAKEIARRKAERAETGYIEARRRGHLNDSHSLEPGITIFAASQAVKQKMQARLKELGIPKEKMGVNIRRGEESGTWVITLSRGLYMRVSALDGGRTRIFMQAKKTYSPKAADKTGWHGGIESTMAKHSIGEVSLKDADFDRIEGVKGALLKNPPTTQKKP
jgi:hypothetical protein